MSATGRRQREMRIAAPPPPPTAVRLHPKRGRICLGDARGLGSSPAKRGRGTTCSVAEGAPREALSQ